MSDLPEDFVKKLYEKYQAAIEGDHLVFNGESASREMLTETIDDTPYEFELTELHSLEKRPETGSVNDNPFLKPEIELTIVPSLDEDFRVVFNKFPVVPAHFMIVTKEFKSQNTPLSPPELNATFSLLRNLKANDASKKWFAFYNCGPNSGASQPHKHIQFMTLPDGLTPFAENLASKSDYFIPNERQEPIQDPNLPFAHFVAKLPEKAEGLTSDVLAMTFVSLLQRACTVLRDNGCKEISYNFCATTEYMMVVPRASGKYKDVLGVNSCGTMGLFLCKNAQLVTLVKEAGPINILKELGFPSVHGLAGTEYQY